MHYIRYSLFAACMALLTGLQGVQTQSEDVMVVWEAAVQETVLVEPVREEPLPQSARLSKPPVYGAAHLPLSDEILQHTWELCQQEDLPLDRREMFYLSLRLMYAESGFNPDAVHYNAGGTVDLGLMQINSSVWEHLRREGLDVAQPEDNVEAGIRILSDYLRQFQDVDYALTAYNHGEQGAHRLEGRSAFARRVQALELPEQERLPEAA